MPVEMVDFETLGEGEKELREYLKACVKMGEGATVGDIWRERGAEIVYSVLGKVLEVHIFGVELFGAQGSQVQGLRREDWMNRNGDGMIIPPLFPFSLRLFPPLFYPATFYATC